MCLRLSVLVCLTAVQLCTGDEPVYKETITPKQRFQLGSWLNTNPDSMDVQNATHHGVDAFNTNSKAKKTFKLFSIESAQFQVTNKIVYRIRATLARSSCLKVDHDGQDSCSLEKKRLKCVFHVAFHPQKDQFKVDNVSCSKL